MNDSDGLDALAQMPNELDDLDNLFEFGDIDLNNIPDADGYGSQIPQQHPGTHPNTPFQDMSRPPPLSGTSAHDFGGHDQFAMAHGIAQQQQHLMGHGEPHAPVSMPYDGMYQPSVQQHIYNPHLHNFPMHSQTGYPSHHQIVPPTPNSFDMHGMAGRFMQQHPHLDPQQRAILEQRYGIRKEEIAFTPMVSPAGTPQFNILPEYTTPGAYFSPLTSPMLHAQTQQHQQQLRQQQQQQGYLTNPSTAPSSNTNSPIDPNVDIDMGDNVVLPESTGPRPRKSGRRKIATAKGAGAAGSKASQSTTQKAQKRKSSAQTQKQTPVSAEDLTLRTSKSQPASAGLQRRSQFDSSEAESISPEPLSDLMGPPPRPTPSTKTSPALSGNQQYSSVNAVAAAATPKSLLTMRTPQQQINGQQNSESAVLDLQDMGGLDDLALPEAATTPGSRRVSLAQIDTQLAVSADDSTPRLGARKTPKLGPSSTPTSTRPQSIVQSPMLGSPMTASTPSAILRDMKDGKGGRGSKKRNSTSNSVSQIVSPALVPKISPSIKPLLPEGTTLNSATQAMLLASKSNYQNLLEGNRLPGVNYPDSLSTGLTSKRTSHKVAEQGRRNRINEALKEMQALIPKPISTPKTPAMGQASGDVDGSPAADDDDKGGEENGVNGQDSRASQEEQVAKSNNSKAATVELANEYIKRMQKDHASQEAMIERLEREKEKLVRRLREGSGSGSGDGVEVG